MIDLLLPHTCGMCGRHIQSRNGERAEICDECIKALPRTEQATLKQNSTEMTVLDQPAQIVRAAKTAHLQRAGAFLFYEKQHPVQRLIHLMKYADRPEIGRTLGRLAAQEWRDSDFFDEIDIIIPIPLHSKRLRERGYNQSEFIARGIGEVLGIEVDTTHVFRIRNTPKQALQSGDSRKQNVADAFAVLHPEQMYHKHILLVDDLITTGETMRACLNAMKAFRGATFTVFTLCKAL